MGGGGPARSDTYMYIYGFWVSALCQLLRRNAKAVEAQRCLQRSKAEVDAEQVSLVFHAMFLIGNWEGGSYQGFELGQRMDGALAADLIQILRDPWRLQ